MVFLIDRDDRTALCLESDRSTVSDYLSMLDYIMYILVLFYPLTIRTSMPQHMPTVNCFSMSTREKHAIDIGQIHTILTWCLTICTGH